MTLDTEQVPAAVPATSPNAFTAGNVQDREAYFLAAYAILGDAGYSALTIAALCERLGVTKGSFYHHFADMPTFVASFARRWQGWLIALLEAYDAEPDVRRRMELICNSHLAAVNGAEPRIRAWAWTNPVVAAAAREVEKVGDRVATRINTRVLTDPGAGEITGMIGTLLMCGLQQRVGSVEPARFVAMVAEHFRRMVGVEAKVVWADYGPAVQILTDLGRAPAVPWTGFTSKWLIDADEAASQATDGARASRTRSTTARRGSRLRAEDFFAAAREILAESGCDGISMTALCERLSVTKGSLTHHFTGMDDFVGRMAADWAADRARWLEGCRAEPDPTVRLDLLHEPMRAEPCRAENAWHAWAWTDSTIAGAVGELEADWQDVLTQTLVELGNEPVTASLLAEMDVGLTLGVQQRRPPLGPEGRRIVADTWLRLGLLVGEQV